MKKTIFSALCVAMAALVSCSPKVEQTTYPAPHLEKRGNVTQLIVKGEPYLALACELGNSSSSSQSYMAPYWDALQESGVNTVLKSIRLFYVY